MKVRYEHALADARTSAESALQQLDAQGQAREAELVRRLEAQATLTAAELEAAGQRAEEAMSGGGDGNGIDGGSGGGDGGSTTMSREVLLGRNACTSTPTTRCRECLLARDCMAPLFDVTRS